MNADEYLKVLNPEQYEAVTHEGSPLLILAGAGSGKTRVITTKIAYLIGEKGFDPRSILAVTFTKKAANEMAERARLLEEKAADTQIRTFHSFGARFLRSFAVQAGIAPNFTVYDDDDTVTLLSKAVPSLSRQQASRAAHKIALAKDYCLFPDSPDLSVIESDPDFPGIYEAYEQRLRETGNVDFGDLIMLPVCVLRSDETVRSRMHERFKVIMVDEYQDSNTAQFLLLQQLVSDGTYICVVGDDDQSIYKFRGAEVKNILNFQEHFPGTKIIRLERNYRSVSPILHAADNVVRNNTERLGKTLHSERGEGKKPVLAFLPAQDAETAFCAELIQEAYKKGCPYSDWAILYRTNAQSLGFETEFLHRKIPYSVVGALKFYEREEIKDILAFLALIANPKDEIAFRRIVNKPARSIGAVSQDKIVDFVREVNRQSRDNQIDFIAGCRMGPSSLTKKTAEALNGFADLIDSLSAFLGKDKDEADNEDKNEDKEEKRLSLFVEKIILSSGLNEHYSAQDEIAGTQKTANMQELANSAVFYPNTRKGLLDFLDHIELDRTLEAAEETDGEKDAVTLITLHNTKGLEFPRVVITGLEKGIFPRGDKTGEELEEERRLFYVGITRAKDELYMTSCSMRRLYGRTDYTEPSLFLYELEKDGIEIIGKTPYGFAPLRKTGFSSAAPVESSNPLARRWARGIRLYHDDWGYGVITKTREDAEDNYVITVQFENGAEKRFLPKYQAHSLMIVSED
ncbi:UvrD-helicase domain-containing protein [Treponema sp. HNW]|uniref:ATP-dependent helicase n=1 Tax=Treponema sp. HNW TaxID=3116654 RepID=UPI003D1333B2